LDAPAILAALPKDTALKTVTAAAADVFGDRSLLAMWGKLATNCVPIERNADFALGVRKLESVLRERRPLILFPEGCRSPNGKLQDFKMGAALLSFRTNTPIIPTAIKGTVVALARKQWVPCPSDVTVQFGRPIEPAPYINAVARGEMDRKRAYADLTRRLRDTIERMRAEM
jgi:1-acyl-sn-glycerol-3-phosphate acyltransferase